MTTISNKTKFHSDTQAINSLVKDNLDKFINHFHLSLNEDSKKIYGPCPIHPDSDNPQGLICYKNSGVWLCTTRGCHSVFGKTSIGFIRGLLSKSKLNWQDKTDSKKVIGFNETIEFILSFLNKKIEEFEVKPDPIRDDKKEFIRQVNLLYKTDNYNNLKQYIEIPSKYYLGRGFSEAVLNKYNVGTLKKQGHQFNNRTIVPILDISGQQIIGFSARVNIERCLVCMGYHERHAKCLETAEKSFLPKWQHSSGLVKTNHLYNYWNSQSIINQIKSAVIVESPSSLWKLEEAGIHNAVAILGSNISKYQCFLLNQCNLKNIYLATDNDEAGGAAKESIKNCLGKKHNYINIELPKNDLGDLNSEEIKKIFKEYQWQKQN